MQETKNNPSIQKLQALGPSISQTFKSLKPTSPHPPAAAPSPSPSSSPGPRRPSSSAAPTRPTGPSATCSCYSSASPFHANATTTASAAPRRASGHYGGNHHAHARCARLPRPPPSSPRASALSMYRSLLPGWMTLSGAGVGVGAWWSWGREMAMVVSAVGERW